MTTTKSRPLTPGQRFLVKTKSISCARNSPQKDLIKIKTRSSGRNCYGRITMRRRGGGSKKFLRTIDYKATKIDIPAVVERIEYDPNRSANIALVKYRDGDKRYILATKNMKSGGEVVASKTSQSEYREAMTLPLELIPQGLMVHNIEIEPGKGGKIARAAGTSAQLIALENNRATLKMPSGEIRCLNSKCTATIGELSNSESMQKSLGKAGRNRWLSHRPRVRGTAMNPVDHPNGGGHGKTAGGGHPVSPWGQLAKSKPTRKKNKPSNLNIITTCRGRKLASR